MMPVSERVRPEPRWPGIHHRSLGIKFDNDKKRREHFSAKLRKKLKDPEFRSTEGFPIGEDEDILAVSDPPYYTVCPNPFIKDFIEHYGTQYDPATDDYHGEPFTSDVSEGKNHPIYNAHSYHTKVPHKALMRYILHHTRPGDLVLDGFCGTGMTGVAAQLCGDAKEIEALGYHINDDGTILDEQGLVISTIGERHPILSGLSPIATFIARNYLGLSDFACFQREALKVIDDVEESLSWLYDHPAGKVVSAIWSDVFLCPHCGEKIVFWESAPKNSNMKRSFPCPSCSSIVGKSPPKADRAAKLVRASCRWSTIMSVVNRSGKMSVHERIDIDPERTGKAPSAQRYPGRSDISG